MSDREIQCRPVVPGDWGAIERLFGPKGACGGCWCMLWRVPSLGRYWESAKGERNRSSFRKLICQGKARGCLARAGGQPVGWCSLGPRDDFPYLARSRTIPDPGIDDAWCVSCFFVPAQWRGRGVAGRLLAAATELAKSAGAAVLEGYPSVPKNAGKPIPPAFAHTGVPRLYAEAGFEHVGDAGARQVWRIRF